MPSNDPDLDLLARIRKGDEQALGIILERYWIHIVRHAAAILGSTTSAEDIAQETFVRIWERRETWKPIGSLRGLLFMISRNLSLDELRRDATHTRAVRHSSGVSRFPTPEEHLGGTELDRAYRHALERLPERRREVYLLVRHHGLSHQEVAQALSLSPQTVANHVRLALIDLREALAIHLSSSPTDSSNHEDGPSKLHLA
jgi:RNA polymerase sigma-70 factor (ECF subfamily)